MRTILVVDDHPTFRATACALLEAEGFVVVGEAADGRSALDGDRAARARTSCCSTCSCPDIDGFEVAARARGARRPRRSIVLTSSRDARDFGSLIAESGARGFIEKAELSGEAMAALIG